MMKGGFVGGVLLGGFAVWSRACDSDCYMDPPAATLTCLVQTYIVNSLQSLLLT